MKTQKQYFYGIKPIIFIWNGAYSDPQISYHGKIFNYFTLEDTMWERFMEDTKAIECYGVDDLGFAKYVFDHKEDVFELLEM